MENDWAWVEAFGTMTTYNFQKTDTIYITPLAGYTEPPTLQVLDTTQDRMASWKSMQCSGVTSQGIVLDVYWRNSACLLSISGYGDTAVTYEFVVTLGSLVYPSAGQDTLGQADTCAKAPQTIAHPVRAYQYDAWNNKISEKDALNHQTTYTYTVTDLQRSRTQPMVDVMDEHGVVTQVQPSTTWAYNSRGFYIGNTDANNHSTGYGLDANGQLVWRSLPSGVVERRQIFDVFGQVTIYYDSRNKKWTRSLDHTGHVLSQISPLNYKQSYTYNELGYQSSYTDQGNSVRRSKYDARSNMIWRSEPLGQTMQTSYDRNRQPLSQHSSDFSLTWKRNFWGIVQSETCQINCV